jgi:hypothetical protein
MGGECGHELNGRAVAGLAAALLLTACAATSSPPRPGTAAVWGYLHLVPREGVTPGGGGAGAYADRSLRDVRFVDYDAPGFAVVHTDVPRAGADETTLVIRDARHGAAFLQPARAVVGIGGAIRVENRSQTSHVVSVPVAGVIRQLAPGASLELATEESQTHGIHLLDAPGQSALVFVAPGAYAVVSETGRFELRDLPPGPHRIHTWHPRFPPVSRRIQLGADETLRLDLDIGVALLHEPHAHP